jgi:hypothetical protein
MELLIKKIRALEIKCILIIAYLVYNLTETTKTDVMKKGRKIPKISIRK